MLKTKIFIAEPAVSNEICRAKINIDKIAHTMYSIQNVEVQLYYNVNTVLELNKFYS
jgi:hypothetical protein